MMTASGSRTGAMRRNIADLSWAVGEGSSSRSSALQACFRPLVPASWPTSERPAAAPSPAHHRGALCETSGDWGPGGTR